MKRNQVRAILTTQTKRRQIILSLIGIIIIVAFLAVANLYVFYHRSQEKYVTYDETSDIDYKVQLKENQFFSDNYLGDNKQYVASLIEKIIADFQYKISMDEENIQYKYSYWIEANVDVKEVGTEKSLYNNSEIIKEKQTRTSTNRDVTISENVNIDYNYYNSLISNFINIYHLDDTISNLTINMHINVVGNCEEKSNIENKESVISLVIPLTTKTVGIDISDNLIDNQNSVLLCDTNDKNAGIFMALGSIFLLLDIGLIGYVLYYNFKTRTAENVYEKELKKILNNYGSYIQKVEGKLIFDNCQVIKIDDFTDMLEIYDTIKQPILMKEYPDQIEAVFIIPSNTNIIYMYKMSMND